MIKRGQTIEVSVDDFNDLRVYIKQKLGIARIGPSVPIKAYLSTREKSILRCRVIRVVNKNFVEVRITSSVAMQGIFCKKLSAKESFSLKVFMEPELLKNWANKSLTRRVS